MAKFFPLFSGSKGNATYIEDNGRAVLVDCGCSLKAVKCALENGGFEPERIEAVFVTHEHRDHVTGLCAFLNKYHLPVYASRETLAALEFGKLMPQGADIRIIGNDGSTDSFGFSRFGTRHDCPGSSGYRFILPSGKTVAVCTDLGIVTDEVRRGITGCELVMIESNHDIGLLQSGSYPYPLKQRILSDHGHLSNPACAAELPSLIEAGAKRIILAHLSQENNRPAIARSAAKAALLEKGMEETRDYLLYIAAQSFNDRISF